MENKEKCQHFNFEVVANVFRLLKDENDKTASFYSLDLKVCCKDCKTDFEFIGMPAGMSHSEPMANIDFTMARLPIMPSSGNMATTLNYKFNENKEEKNDIN